MASLHERLNHWARVQPDAPFVIDAETGATLTYGQCQRAVVALRRTLGPIPRRLTVALPGGIAATVLWLSALTGGHAITPLDPSAHHEERLRSARLYPPDVVVIASAKDAASFPQAERLLLGDCEALIQQALARSDDQADEEARDLGGQLCMTTSGSTGDPKGVALRSDQVAQTARQIAIAHHLASADRGFTPLPFFHINAPVVSMCASLMVGGAVVIAPHFSLSHFWAWVEDFAITWVSVVPTILAFLLATEKPTFLPGSLRFVRTASAPLSPAHLATFERRFAIPVIETYGLTEAASTVCANPLPPERHKPGSVGRPVGGVSVRVCYPRLDSDDGALRDVAPGEVGEICISGESVAQAYVGGADPDAFSAGWFRTGDQGRRDAEGYIFLTGRFRDIIIRGGENIAPREIEDVLLDNALVQQAAVVGAPDPLYGEHVIAYVVLRDHPDGAQATAAATWLKRRCAQALSPYKTPDTIVALPALPRTPNGKVDRPRLRWLASHDGGASQREASQREASQREASQREASQREASQRAVGY